MISKILTLCTLATFALSLVVDADRISHPAFLCSFVLQSSLLTDAGKT